MSVSHSIHVEMFQTYKESTHYADWIGWKMLDVGIGTVKTKALETVREKRRCSWIIQGLLGQRWVLPTESLDQVSELKWKRNDTVRNKYKI